MAMPNDIKTLIHEYIKQKGKRPLAFNYDEWKSLAEYKEYLEKELMDYKEIKEKALKETDVDKLLNLIEDYKLQNDKEIMDYFRSIDTVDTIEYSLYPRRKKN